MSFRTGCFSACVFFALQAAGQAESFHKRIENGLTRIDEAAAYFNEQLAIFNGDSILKAYDLLLRTTEDVIAEVAAIEPLRGAENYHLASLQYFRFLLEVYENDYYQAVALLYQAPDSDETTAAIEHIFDRIELKEALVFDHFLREQIDFCIAMGIENE